VLKLEQDEACQGLLGDFGFEFAVGPEDSHLSFEQAMEERFKSVSAEGWTRQHLATFLGVSLPEDDPHPMELIGFPQTAKPDVLLISHISELGPLACWNSEHPESEVQVGDHIIEVNGVSAIDAMQQELACATAIWMNVRRFVPPFEVLLDRKAVGGFGFIFRSPLPPSE